MKKINVATSNFTTRDKFNIKVSKSLKDAVNEKLTILKACVGEDVDKDNNEVRAAAFITDKGAYSSISSTVIDCVEDLIEMIDDGEENLTVMVEERTSNSNRDYLVLTLV